MLIGEFFVSLENFSYAQAFFTTIKKLIFFVDFPQKSDDIFYMCTNCTKI